MKSVLRFVGAMAVAVAGIFAFAWVKWSRQYIIRWHDPFRENASTIAIHPNVCIEPRQEGSAPGDCAEVLLFPHVYASIGVDEQKLIDWQEANGFQSNGVDRAGNLLAPEYPVFSRLAWTVVDSVSLEGSELQELIDECSRIRQRTDDPNVRRNVDNILRLAIRAKSESRALRFS